MNNFNPDNPLYSHGGITEEERVKILDQDERINSRTNCAYCKEQAGYNVERIGRRRYRVVQRHPTVSRFCRAHAEEELKKEEGKKK